MAATVSRSFRHGQAIRRRRLVARARAFQFMLDDRHGARSHRLGS
jgi:hypothetical protein